MTTAQTYSLTVEQRKILIRPRTVYDQGRLPKSFAEELARMPPVSPEIKPFQPIDEAMAALERQYREELNSK